MPESLNGIRAKLRRGRTHIDDLRTAVDAFANRHPFRLEVIRPSPNQFEIRSWAQDVTLPIEVPLLAGEAAHQLRSSLDHLACHLVLSAGRIPDRMTGFPICLGKEAFERREQKALNGVSKEVRQLIRRCQPFECAKPSEDLLWVLQDLNNTDKHRMIPITLVTIDELLTRVSEDETTYADYFTLRLPLPLRDGGTIVHMGVSHLERDVRASVRCTLAFQNVGGLGNQPVVKLLSSVADRVENVIVGIETALKQ